MDTEETTPNSVTAMDTFSDSNSNENTCMITVHIHPTTGGQFDIEIAPADTADELRRKISRHLQTPKERLKLLHKETLLEGKLLKDYNIVDGSRITLLPAVESGFSSTVQGTQQSIIQAIEGLSDPQIDDFLTGRLPLTLALRVGDHMMFVQLQLEQTQPNTPITGSSNTTPEPRMQRNHHGKLMSPHSRHSSSTAPPRLSDTSLMTMPATLTTTAMTAKPSINSIHKNENSPSRSEVADHLMTGPLPKMPKLNPSVNNGKKSMSESNGGGVMYNRHHFHPSPEELPRAVLDPRLEGLQQFSNHYHQITSHANYHPHVSASHLHKLVSACSSLGQVVAIPPTAGALKVPPVTDHNAKSSRKRPSNLLAPDLDGTSPSSSQNRAFLGNIGTPMLTTPAAIIQNALLRQHQLIGFPPPSSASLLPSAYARLHASSRAGQNTSMPPTSTSSSAPTTPTSPPTEMRLKHPITSTMLQESSAKRMPSSGTSLSGHKSDRSHNHYHHRRSSASGKITSSSLSSHHPSGISGARVVRQMQRLRRLCGSHQQCVAYSSRELATEISSIVHLAKHSHHHHHSRSEGSSHRKNHKSCRECHAQDRAYHRAAAPSQSVSGSSGVRQASQTTGACIDSFTTHGPGIFSGTFSGSLHPSIQDKDGRPKRDPKTILQILTDLLNATHQYQGQLGNIGLLPQLFKDHFKGDAKNSQVTDSKLKEAQEKQNAKSQKQSTGKVSNIYSVSASRTHSPSSNVQAPPHSMYHPSSYLIPSNAFVPMTMKSDSSVPKAATAPASYLSSVSTIPISNIPVNYGSHHQHISSSHSRSSKQASGSGQEGSSSSPRHHHHHHHNHRHSSRCHYHKQQQQHQYAPGLPASLGMKLTEKGACCGMSRRASKSQMLNSAYVKRLKQLQHENNTTRNKMKELKQMMEMQRRRRQCRRNASKLYNRRNRMTGENKSLESAAMAVAEGIAEGPTRDSASQNALNSGNVEVKFDDIKEYEIVAHEPPETVTV